MNNILASFIFFTRLPFWKIKEVPAALPCGYFLRSFFFLLSFIYYLLFVEKDTLTPSRGNKDVFTLLKIHV